MQIGDLVKWYDYYAEGDIVKDAGLGIVLRVIEKAKALHPLSYYADELYLIQRMNYHNQEWYTSHSIDIIAKGIHKNA